LAQDETSGPRTSAKSRVLPTDPLPPEHLKEPPQDFYCPVTYCLMLRPHLTSCCGQNLSEEAAKRIQAEGKACPLCRASTWSKKINREMQKEVKSLQTCPMKDSPLVTRSTW
ncbi:hypothetical protein GBAR_LOCUS23451, partial [Geodia barretti]